MFIELDLFVGVFGLDRCCLVITRARFWNRCPNVTISPGDVLETSPRDLWDLTRIKVTKRSLMGPREIFRVGNASSLFLKRSYFRQKSVLSSNPLGMSLQEGESASYPSPPSRRSAPKYQGMILYQRHVHCYAEHGAWAWVRSMLMMKNDGFHGLEAADKPKWTEKRFRCADAQWWSE